MYAVISNYRDGYDKELIKFLMLTLHEECLQLILVKRGNQFRNSGFDDLTFRYLWFFF